MAEMEVFLNNMDGLSYHRVRGEMVGEGGRKWKWKEVEWWDWAAILWEWKRAYGKYGLTIHALSALSGIEGEQIYEEMAKCTYGLNLGTICTQIHAPVINLHMGPACGFHNRLLFHHMLKLFPTSRYKGMDNWIGTPHIGVGGEAKELVLSKAAIMFREGKYLPGVGPLPNGYWDQPVCCCGEGARAYKDPTNNGKPCYWCGRVIYVAIPPLPIGKKKGKEKVEVKVVLT